MEKSLNKMALLEKLERIKYEKDNAAEQSELEQMSLSSALLVLSEINHEREYALCQDLAKHLLGKVPEPDDADLVDE